MRTLLRRLWYVLRQRERHDDAHAPGPAGDLVGRGLQHDERRPEQRIARWKCEPGSRDADDGHRFAVDHDAAPDDRRIRIDALAPAAIAQHGDAGARVDALDVVTSPGRKKRPIAGVSPSSGKSDAVISAPSIRAD